MRYQVLIWVLKSCLKKNIYFFLNEQGSIWSNLRDSMAVPCISTGRGGELGARKPNLALHCSCTAVTSTPRALHRGAHFWCLTSDPSLRVRYTQPAYMAQHLPLYSCSQGLQQEMYPLLAYFPPFPRFSLLFSHFTHFSYQVSASFDLALNKYLLLQGNELDGIFPLLTLQLWPLQVNASLSPTKDFSVVTVTAAINLAERGRGLGATAAESRVWSWG